MEKKEEERASFYTLGLPAPHIVAPSLAEAYFLPTADYSPLYPCPPPPWPRDWQPARPVARPNWLAIISIRSARAVGTAGPFVYIARRRSRGNAQRGQGKWNTQYTSPLLIRQFCSLRSPDISPSFSPRRNPYPNPGYLGSSSHAAIFKHITADGDHGSTAPGPEGPSSPWVGDNHLLLQGADVLRILLTSYPLSAMKELVMFWLAKGANLALAEPFVAQCAETASQLFTLHDENWHLVFARRLLQNSAMPLRFNVDSTLSGFSAQFLDHNARWETLGIFFAAISRATIDIPFFPLLYTTEEEQFALRRLATKLSDFALEISLSLDCLNDLQLIVQYENFIVHSYVDGDQSVYLFPFSN